MICPQNKMRGFGLYLVTLSFNTHVIPLTTHTILNQIKLTFLSVDYIWTP